MNFYHLFSFFLKKHMTQNRLFLPCDNVVAGLNCRNLFTLRLARLKWPQPHTHWYCNAQNPHLLLTVTFSENKE
jgi:hypothetical protein